MRTPLTVMVDLSAWHEYDPASISRVVTDAQCAGFDVVVDRTPGVHLVTLTSADQDLLEAFLFDRDLPMWNGFGNDPVWLGAPATRVFAAADGGPDFRDADTEAYSHDLDELEAAGFYDESEVA